MAVSGSQFTRIGAGLSGVAKRLVITPKAAATGITGTLAVTLEPTAAVLAGHVAGAITGTLIVTLGVTQFKGEGNVDTEDTGEPMTRIVNILTRARDTLADPLASRWTDDRLLRLLDEAQKDVAKQTKILKGTHDMALTIGVSNYTLPDNVWLITRATFDNYEIPLVSYDQQDEQARKEVIADRTYNTHERRRGYGSDLSDRYGRINWELAEGSRVESLVYDNRNINDIRVYPIPNDDIADTSYTFLNEGETVFVGDELLGVTTSIDDYTIDTVYGLVASLFDPAIENEIFDSPFGVITGISETVALVKIWYIRIPDEITALTSVLETPPMFDVALKHYIIGHALRDDIDVQYRDMATESLALYKRELGVADETNRSDGTRNAVNFNTTYRGGFE